MSYSAVVVCSKQASPFLRKQPYFLVGLIMMCVILNFILFPVIASFQNQKLLSNEAMKQFESAAALRIKTCASQRQIGERKRMKDESTEKQFNERLET